MLNVTKSKVIVSSNNIIVDMALFIWNSVLYHLYRSIPIFTIFHICSRVNCFQVRSILAVAECLWSLICRQHDQKKSWYEMTGQWSVFVPGSPKTPYWLDKRNSMKTCPSLNDCMVSAFQTQLHNMTGFCRYVRPRPHMVRALWSITVYPQKQWTLIQRQYLVGWNNI